MGEEARILGVEELGVNLEKLKKTGCECLLNSLELEGRHFFLLI
jgi:hypothetical protein